MKRLKGLLIGCLLVVLAISFDNHIFHEERKMRKALAWVIIAALLIIVVRVVSAQAFQPVQKDPECVPVAVGWSPDSTKIVSFGCAVFRGDTLVLVHHIASNGNTAYTLIMREQVRQLYKMVIVTNPP